MCSTSDENNLLIEETLLSYFNYYPLTKYEFESATVEANHNERFCYQKPEDISKTEDLVTEKENFELAGTLYGPALRVKRNYEPFTKILPCYGIVKLDGCELEDLMISTKFGLVIDGRKKSGIWRFLHPSCDPNTKLRQKWNSETKSLFLYFESVKPINVGDILTCYHKDIIISSVDNYNCVCKPAKTKKDSLKEQKKIQNRTCLVKDCKSYLHVFYDSTGLRRHNRQYHQSSTEKLCCDVPGCERNEFKERHMREVHHELIDENKRVEYRCIHCKRGFRRIGSLHRHLVGTKKGCKSLNDKMRKRAKMTENIQIAEDSDEAEEDIDDDDYSPLDDSAVDDIFSSSEGLSNSSDNDQFKRVTRTCNKK